MVLGASRCAICAGDQLGHRGVGWGFTPPYPLDWPAGSGNPDFQLPRSGNLGTMFTVDDFSKDDWDGLEDVELPVSKVFADSEELLMSRITFRYRRDLRPRLTCFSRDSKFVSEVFDKEFKLDDKLLPGEFLCHKQVYRSEGDVALELGPKHEPFSYGDPNPISHARCIVVNGPNTFFNGRPLYWETDTAQFQYEMFGAVRDCFKHPEDYFGASIPSGILTMTPRESSMIAGRELWRVFFNASRVLSYAAGTGVGVGHVEAMNGENVQFRLLGFSRFDWFSKIENWHDMETVKDFHGMAAAFSRFLEHEPINMPLTYSLEFYRASNASRPSSLELSLISSYSALEILVHHVLREQAKWSNDLLKRGRFPDKARAATAFIGLGADPLEHASHLKPKLKSFNDMDGFSALAEARNSIVHSEKSFRLEGIDLEEIWRMSQWLVEIFVFHLIGYSGLMSDRRRMTGWRGEGVRRVPLGS